MADAKGCRDCGQLVRWTPYEVNAKGEFLRGDDGKVIVHKCDRRAGEGAVREVGDTDKEPTIPFGKYKGWKVSSLAATAEGIDYLKWLSEKAQQQWLKDAIREALASEYGSNLRPAGSAAGESAGDSWDD